jgi:hypothetical protein
MKQNLPTQFDQADMTNIPRAFHYPAGNRAVYLTHKLENSLWSFLELPGQSDESFRLRPQLCSARSEVEGGDSRREAIFVSSAIKWVKCRRVGRGVRFGSKADIANLLHHVRFTPESGLMQRSKKRTHSINPSARNKIDCGTDKLAGSQGPRLVVG